MGSSLGQSPGAVAHVMRAELGIDTPWLPKGRFLLINIQSGLYCLRALYPSPVPKSPTQG